MVADGLTPLPCMPCPPFHCMRCDFATGSASGEPCETCGGTGVIYRVGGRVYPGTPEGFEAAAAALGEA